MIPLASALASATLWAAVVEYPDERTPWPLEPVVQREVSYYRLDQVASSLLGWMAWRPSAHQATVCLEPDSVMVTVDSRFVLANGRGFCLDHAPVYLQGHVLVPEEFVRGLAVMLPQRVSWSDSAGCLRLAPPPCDLGIQCAWQESLGFEARVDMGPSAPWALYAIDSSRVALWVFGAVACTTGVLASEGPEQWALTILPGPGRVCLELQLPPTQVGVTCGRRGSQLTWRSVPQAGVAGAPERPLRCVVIDPGHGGLDPGVTGIGGVVEKEVTLALAASLRERLARVLPGVRVVLTREGDTSLSGDDRARVANQSGADLFLSLHCNWSFQRTRRGASIMVQHPWAHQDTAYALGGLVLVPPEQGRGLVPWTGAEYPWIAASASVAWGLSQALDSRGFPVERVRQVPLAVLEGVAMPAVLVEVGYLSNPMEARDLASLQFLQSYAEALADGLAMVAQRAGPAP